jgi:hypothetical protein
MAAFHGIENPAQSLLCIRESTPSLRCRRATQLFSTWHQLARARKIAHPQFKGERLN